MTDGSQEIPSRQDWLKYCDDAIYFLASILILIVLWYCRRVTYFEGHGVCIFWGFVFFGAFGVIADFVLRLLWECLYDHVDAKRPPNLKKEVFDPKAASWVPRCLGIIERILFTMLIAWQVNGGAAFIGTWIVIKTAGMAWQVFSGKEQYGEYFRQAFGVSLMLSGISALFGLLGGLWFSHMCPSLKY